MKKTQIHVAEIASIEQWFQAPFVSQHQLSSVTEMLKKLLWGEPQEKADARRAIAVQWKLNFPVSSETLEVRQLYAQYTRQMIFLRQQLTHFKLFDDLSVSQPTVVRQLREKYVNQYEERSLAFIENLCQSVFLAIYLCTEENVSRLCVEIKNESVAMQIKKKQLVFESISLIDGVNFPWNYSNIGPMVHTIVLALQDYLAADDTELQKAEKMLWAETAIFHFLVIAKKNEGRLAKEIALSFFIHLFSVLSGAKKFSQAESYMEKCFSLVRNKTPFLDKELKKIFGLSLLKFVTLVEEKSDENLRCLVEISEVNTAQELVSDEKIVYLIDDALGKLLTGKKALKGMQEIFNTELKCEEVSSCFAKLEKKEVFFKEIQKRFLEEMSAELCCQSFEPAYRQKHFDCFKRVMMVGDSETMRQAELFLLTAAKEGEFGWVRWLLKQGCSPQIKTEALFTPLHYVVLSGKETAEKKACVLDLLDCGALWFLPNNKNKTASSYAEENNQQAIVALFQDRYLIHMPSTVKYIVEQILSRKERVFIHGGAVRDTLLGRTIADYDLITTMSVLDVLMLFKQYVIDVTWTDSCTFQTEEGVRVDMTTLRYSPDKEGLFHALKRSSDTRDLTINALIWDPLTHRIEDFHGGKKDLEDGVLRIVGDPAARYQADPVIMLRTIRLALSLKGFHIEKKAETALRDNADHLTNLSPYRLWREKEKISQLLGGDLNAMESYGAFSSPLLNVSISSLTNTGFSLFHASDPSTPMTERAALTLTKK